MDKTINGWAFFYAIAIAQSIFLVLLLLAKKDGNIRANRLLASLIFLLSVYMLDTFLGFFKFFHSYPHTYLVVAPLWYLFPGMMYFYVRTVLGDKLTFSWKSLLHFLPVVYVMFWFIPFYFLPAEIKLQYLNNTRQIPGGNVLVYFYTNMSPLQLLVYTFLVIKKSKLFKSEKLNQANTRWLIFFVTLIGIFELYQFIAINIFFFTGLKPISVKYLPLALFSAIIYTIGYLAIVNPKIIFPENVIRLITKPQSVLTNTQLEYYANKVRKEIERDQLYLDPDLKYTALASRVGVSARYMSEIINRYYGISFTDLINEYRVKEVQQRLVDKSNRQFTLLAIAMDSGFNSKASFNRIFKKHSGMTPSEYVRNNNPDLLH